MGILSTCCLQEKTPPHEFPAKLHKKSHLFRQAIVRNRGDIQATTKVADCRSLQSSPPKYSKR